MTQNNFFNHFKQEAVAQQNANFEDNRPKLKAPTVFLNNKTNPSMYLRILPTMNMINNVAFDLGAKYRELKYFKDNKPYFIRLAPEVDVNNAVEQDIRYWQDSGFLVGMYGKIEPKPFHALLAIPVIQDANGGWVEQRKENGELNVIHLDLKSSGYQRLCDKLADPLLSPPNEALSFLSLKQSFLVGITCAKKGEMSDKVDVYSNIPLGNIEGQVEHLIEDLHVLQYTTEEVSPEFLNKLREANGSASNPVQQQQVPQQQQQQYQPPVQMQYQPPAQTQYQPPVQTQYQAPVQNQAPQQAPQAPVQTQYQAPVQNQAPQQAPQAPVQNQAPQQAPQAPVQNQAPQQAPQAPVQNQAPQQQATPPTPNAGSMDGLQAMLAQTLQNGLGNN